MEHKYEITFTMDDSVACLEDCFSIDQEAVLDWLEKNHEPTATGTLIKILKGADHTMLAYLAALQILHTTGAAMQRKMMMGLVGMSDKKKFRELVQKSNTPEEFFALAKDQKNT